MDIESRLEDGQMKVNWDEMMEGEGKRLLE